MSTTRRATYRLKCLLSVADARCRAIFPFSRSPSDSLESFCYWQFREREQTRSTSSLCCHSPRDTPPQSLPVPPKGIPFSPLFDTSTRFPPPNGRARSLLEPCLIAYSPHLPKSLLQDACRVINIYSLEENSGYQISRGFVSFSKVIF